MAGRIFINYRRGDDPGFTHALYQRLEQRFSRDRLFFDLGGHIQPGDDFVEVLSEQVRLSDVVLVVIGPRWTALLEERRDDAEDFVLIEIKAALEQGKRIIPVLVGGARMPAAAGLPTSIQPLARRHAIELRAVSFADDCDGLAKSLDALVERARTSEPQTESLPTIVWEPLAAGEFSHQFTMPSETLRWLLEKCSFAMSSDEKRFYLNGLYLHSSKGPNGDPTLCAVATDGHRLVRVMIASVPQLADMPAVILPRQAVSEVLSMLVGAQGRARIAVARGAVRFEIQGLRYRTTPIDGIFPDYNRVFPTQTSATTVVDSNDMIEKVARLAGNLSEPASVKLTIGIGFLEIVPLNEGAETSARVAVVRQTGNVGLSIGLGVRYLLEILRRAVGAQVEICLDTSSTPAIFRAPGSDALVFVLMPVKF